MLKLQAFLLEAGAATDLLDNRGSSALMYAVDGRRKGAARLLLEAGGAMPTEQRYQEALSSVLEAETPSPSGEEDFDLFA